MRFARPRPPTLPTTAPFCLNFERNGYLHLGFPLGQRGATSSGGIALMWYSLETFFAMPALRVSPDPTALGVRNC